MTRNPFFCKALISISLFVLGLIVPGIVMAHCDSVSGPVAVDAREALSHENFETVAIWVGEEQHDELHAAFEKTLAVYQMGGQAKELAQQYFMETAVRLHRAAEGMAYTGLKPSQPLPPDISAAEKALETGNLGPVQDMLASEMKQNMQQLFEKAKYAKQNKNISLEAGRKWADAYVKYVIYVHGIYKTIQSGPAHGVGE